MFLYTRQPILVKIVIIGLFYTYKGVPNMRFLKKTTLNEKILLFIIAVVGFGALNYYVYFYTPKDSLELYQAIAFADDFEEAQKHMLKGYEANFKKEDFEFINKLENSPNTISQLTLFEYNGKTYVISTTPGQSRLEVLAVEELPEEIRNYFLQLP